MQRLDILDPGGDDLRIQAKFPDHPTEENRLALIRFNENNFRPRPADGNHNSRETSAGPQVRPCFAVPGSLYDLNAVGDMTGPKILDRSLGNQVYLWIPETYQILQPLELGRSFT
ncbi:hypothetical protein SAMN04488020_10699 [Palleronia marisminoris]|uniref:Uncharacterized protein n=1 Tax=Palleronia marisminoris TaxID=315423 RepID=A0A1Y5T0H6_9RHOB|nr:hypothetical protein SAMN04488020_10699 [Palleronia marisminoris]SLN51286.1 hypothetical protein PAM7066_02332 [Palleronia marisminoris]